MRNKFLLTKFLMAAMVSAMTISLLSGCGSSSPSKPKESEASAKDESMTGASVETEAETESACAHEWQEATFAAPKTCAICGETEGEAKKSYFEEHGATVLDAPVDITTTAIIYNPDNIAQQKNTDITWKQTNLYSEPADEKGYQLVHLDLTGFYQFYYDAANGINYVASMYNCDFYDWYTGRKFPKAEFFGDNAVETTAAIDVDGVSYDVTYTVSIEYEHGEWSTDSSGNATLDSTFYYKSTLKIPDGYDGLVFALIPPTEVTREDIDEMNSGEVDYSEKYAFDEDECPPDTIFFRINKEGMVATEASTETTESSTNN